MHNTLVCTKHSVKDSISLDRFPVTFSGYQVLL